MSAQPIHEAFPDDLAEILRVLPPRRHAQFLDEYRAAVEAAREVQHWPAPARPASPLEPAGGLR